jgi:hypothetical protein
MKPGDALLSLVVLVWVSISVGPWWVGVIAFLAAWVLNAIHVLRSPAPRDGRDE